MKESVDVDLEGIIVRRRKKYSDEDAYRSEAASDDIEKQEEAAEEVDSDEGEEFIGIESDLDITSMVNILPPFS